MRMAENSQGSSFSIGTRLRPGRPWFDSGRARLTLGLPNLLFNGYQGLFLRG